MSALTTARIAKRKRMIGRTDIPNKNIGLLLLEKFAPLTDLPGYDLHLLCSQVYGRLDLTELSKKHLMLANAYGVLLNQRIDKGDKEDANYMPARKKKCSFSLPQPS